MSKKILLADDSITIQKVIELTFSDEDFEVVTVGNGRLALERLADTRPDVVLCDIIMPERDGYEVCERIKKNPETAHIPVLLLTGAFEPFDQERAARAGSDGFLAKPFEPETLIAKVKELLARAPSRTSAPSVPPRVDTPPPPPPPAAPKAPPPLPRAAPAAAPAPLSRPSSMSSFLPEEPFDAFDTEAIEEVVPEDGVDRQGSFAPVTPEESAALTGPAEPGESSPADASSTVMFQAGDVPWEATGGFSAPEPTVPPVQRMVEPEPMVSSEPEVFLAPDSDAGSTDEGPSFEEVIEEEDGAYAAAERYPAEEPAAEDEASSTVMFEPAPEPPPSRDPSTTGRFPPLNPPSRAPIETAPPIREEAEAPQPRSSPPPPVFEMASRDEEELPEIEPELPAARSPVETPAPPLRPHPDAPPRPESFAPAPPPPDPVEQTQAPVPAIPESFADVAETETAGVPLGSGSEAASMPVPVEMVEKIAQRVVAQVSEKIVREIAWEVIPDLAEALIKQEIDRLKAELQKL